MSKQKKTKKHIKAVDDTVKLPEKQGNGILKYSVSINEDGKIMRYSFTYINPHIYTGDNGRVLGYDNCHGYHHRHFMGKEYEVDCFDFEDIQDRFEKMSGRYYMKKSKSKKAPVKVLKVKTGSVKEFFAGARELMRAADRGETIKKRCATLTFVDPTEMLHFLSAAKIKLINNIRQHPDSITNIAKAMKELSRLLGEISMRWRA